MNEIHQRIDELAALMEEHKILKMEYSSEELSLCFSKIASSSKSSEPINTIKNEILIEPTIEIENPSSILEGIPIKSPLMGIFYSSSDPHSPPFVQSGEQVVQGQIIGLVEAMKVFNEIVAPHSGIVSEYCIQHGQLIQSNDIILYLSTSLE